MSTEEEKKKDRNELLGAAVDVASEAVTDTSYLDVVGDVFSGLGEGLGEVLGSIDLS